MTPVCQPATAARSISPGGITVRAQIVLAACGCAGASSFLFAVDPSHHAVYPQCLIYNATGFYCAGCGATRAIHALLHGRILAALHDNALFVTALPLLLFVVGSYALQAWRNRFWPRIDIDSRSVAKGGGASLLIILAFMILRNLPGWPFEYLKPLP
jgi:hypothetical protein